MNEKGSQLQTAHRSMFDTNVSPFGLLQCMVDIGQYLVKLGRLQDHNYIYVQRVVDCEVLRSRNNEWIYKKC